MVKKEVINIHIGQAGCQIGTACWELYLLEHGIGPDGYSTYPDDNVDNSFESFFEEVENNRYVPRTLFLDSEPNVIDEIKSGVYQNLFHPDQLLNGEEDGANNFARGSFTLGSRHLVSMLDKIRLCVENCEQIQGFIITHSFSGGTGSGLTSVLLNALTIDFTKIPRIQVPVFPGPTLATAIVEPYNCTFHIHSSMETTDLAFVLDNEALYQVISQNMLIAAPNFTTINRLLALINSAITCSMRFEGTLNADISDMRTNLIPFPRIHFPIVAHAPIMHTSRVLHNTVTVRQLMNNVFSSEYQLINFNINKGAYIAIMLNVRGLISPLEVNENVQRLKKTKQIDFVDWSPNGFKICLNNQIPSVVPESNFAVCEKSITMVSNSTSVRDCWTTMCRKFDLLYDKKAFVHWFIGEGMEESEFLESRFNIGLLCEDYCEIGMSQFDIENAFDKTYSSAE